MWIRTFRVTRVGSVCLFVLVLGMLAGCSVSSTPATPLPTPLPLPEEASLIYVIRIPVGETGWEIESVTLYPDGQVSYEHQSADTENTRQGEQFVGAPGVAHFLSLFEAAGFDTLAPSYQRADASDRVRHLTLLVRGQEGVHAVQWEPDVAPSSLGDALRELNQFLDVVRASAS